MPLRNRVSPLGELLAVPDRGLVFGNRGCLHDAAGRIRRDHAGRRWIACRLEFPGRRRRPLLRPGRYTELFFLDDATALAAGHRPCAECRRADYDRLRRLLPGAPGADAIDERLHAERLEGAGRRLHDVAFRGLPTGACVLHAGVPHAVLEDALLPWSPGGYGSPARRPRSGRAQVLTPPLLLALLGEGEEPLVPLLHPSARGGL